jgi:hypothetical protein
MDSILGVKPWEEGFNDAILIASAIGLGGLILCFWMAWKLDQRNAKKHGDSRFTVTRLLILVAIIALLVSVLLPSGPLRVQRTRPSTQESTRSVGGQTTQPAAR